MSTDELVMSRDKFDLLTEQERRSEIRWKNRNQDRACITDPKKRRRRLILHTLMGIGSLFAQFVQGLFEKATVDSSQWLTIDTRYHQVH